MNKIKSLLFISFAFNCIFINAQIQTFAPTIGTYAALDAAVKNFMQKWGLTNDVVATLAISSAGKILYKQAYAGELLLNTKPNPDVAMRIASCTKPFTAAAIKQLAIDKKFNLEDPFYNFLTTGNNAISLLMPGKSLVDPQVTRVRIIDLLNHTGGWDISILGWDPMGRMTTIAQDYRILDRPTPVQIIAWMLSNYPLQHQLPAPYSYSNFEYCILGRVIEKAAGKSYIDYLKNDLLRNSLPTLNIAHSKSRNPNEIQWYLSLNNSLSYYSLNCNDQTYGYWVESMDSHGGLIASAPDLCTFMTQFWLTGDRRALGSRGSAYFWGSLTTTLAITHQDPSGIDLAFIMNSRPQDGNAFQEINDLLVNAIRSLPPIP